MFVDFYFQKINMGTHFIENSLYVFSGRGTGFVCSYLPSQIFAKQSLPPVTNLRTGGCAAGLFGPVAAAMDPPGMTEGAQLTELTPIGCAWKIWWLQLLSLNSSTETLPSEEAHARRQPASCGAQLTRFTLAVC